VKKTRHIILGLFLFVQLIIFSNIAIAVSAYPYPIEFTQPDGSKITILLKGDEKVRWAETMDGYSIIHNKQGAYEYAMLDENHNMIPSGFSVKNINQRSIEDHLFLKSIPKGLHYSVNQINQMKSVWLNESGSLQNAFPTTGNRKLLVILANFSNTTTTYPSSNFDNYMNQLNYNGTGSFKDYYLEVSYGQLTIVTTVSAWVSLPNTHDYYGPEALWGQYALDAITAANNQTSVNFADFDNDLNGVVDGVAIFHQGQGQEETGSTLDIWSHSWDLTSAGFTSAQRTFDGVLVNSYTTMPERNSTGMGTIGVMCHEFGHNLGSPDFYDINYSTGGQYDGTGKWDLMASGSWNGTSGNKPAHPNAYIKTMIFNWASPTTINSASLITLNNAAENTNSFYRFNTTTTNEYFLIENRQQLKFDTYIPGHGMIIYHVDGNYISTASGINAGSHQGMYPVCANATGNPPTTYGTINSGGCPFPGTGSKTSFTDVSTPNSMSWAAANTAKPITYISENITNKTVSFAFMGGVSCTAPTTQATTFTSSAITDNSMTIAWTRGTGNSVMVVARSGSAVTELPVNGTAYSASTVFGGGTQIGSGNYVVYNGTGSSVNITALTAGTTYYYTIYEYTLSTYCYLSPALTGSATTTGTAPCTYCASTGNTSYQTSTTLVNFNTMNNITAKPAAYSDYTALSTPVNKNSTYNLTVNINTDGYYTIHAWAWIDWNQDCDFLDIGEAYDLGTALNTTNGTTTLSPLSITIPPTALSGNTRMRVSSKYNNDPTSCETGFDGEVEDYTINIASSCTAVVITTQPVISQTTCAPSASINFAVAANTGTAPITYQWQYNNNGTWQNVTNGIPAGATYTNGTSDTMSVSGITATSTYQYRCYLSNCSGANNATSNTASLVVIGIPSSAGNITGTTSVCQNQTSVTYTVPAIANTTSYVWTLPNGANGVSSTNTIIVDYNSSAISGNITVKGQNSCGFGLADTLAITVNSLPNNQILLNEAFDYPVGNFLSGLGWTAHSGFGANVIPIISGNLSYNAYPLPNGQMIKLLTTGEDVSKVIGPKISNTTYAAFLVKITTASVSGDYFAHFIKAGTSSVFAGRVFVKQDTSNTAKILFGVGKATNITTPGTVYASNSVDTNLTHLIVLKYTANAATTNDDVISLFIDPSISDTEGTPNLIATDVALDIDSTYLGFALRQGTSTSSPSLYVDGIRIASSWKEALGLSLGQNIIGQTTVCQGESNVIYSVPAIANATSYIWTLPNGATGSSSTNSISVNYGNSAVSGNIIVKPHNFCGDGDSSILAITVKSLPSITATVSDTICGAGIVTIGATTSSGTINWYSDLTGGSAIYTGTDYSPSISATTTFYADVSNNGCISYPRTAVTAIINSIPDIISTTSDTICAPGIATLSATASYGVINWYSDSILTSPIAFGPIFSPSITATTNYYVDATDNGCTSPTRTLVTAMLGTLPIVIANTTATNVCEGIAVTLSGSGTTGVTYTWDNGVFDGMPFTPTTTKTYTLTGTSTNGCQNTANVVVTVNPAPPLNPISGTTILCEGELNLAYSVVLHTFGQPLPPNSGHGTDTDQPDGAVNNYVWSYSGIASIYPTSTVNAINMNFASGATSGILTVVETDPITACSRSNQLTITVNPLPGNAGIISGVDTICAGQQNIIYAVPVITNATIYNWTLPSGATGISTTHYITINYGTSAVSDSITVKGSNSCGESNASVMAITVNQLSGSAGIISGTSTVCQGQNNVIYTVPAIVNASSYSWTLPLGATGSSFTNSISVNYGNSAVSGNISVKAQNSCGDGDSSILAITVNAIPSENPISGTEILCEGTLNSSYSVALHTYGQPLPPVSGHGIVTDQADGAAYNYVWSYSGTAAISPATTVNTINMNFAPGATSGILTVVETDPTTACSRSNHLFININPLPSTPNVISGADTVCQGQNIVNYTIPLVPNAVSYSWTLPLGATGYNDSNNITVNYSKNAVSGNISVKGHNECGDGNPSILAINVNPLPDPAGVISGTANICLGESNTIYTIPSITNATSYSWILPTGANGISSANSITVNYGITANSGNITVSGINSCGNGDSSTLAIAVAPPPLESTFTAAVSNEWEKCENWDQGIPGSITNASIAATKLAIVNSNNYQCKNLTIAPLGKLTINDGKDITVNDTLLLKSDMSGTASLIDNGSLLSAENIVECFIPHTYPDEFHMLSSAVKAQPISPFFLNGLDDFYTWNELTGEWINYNDSRFDTVNYGLNFIPGKAYAVSYPYSTVRNFTGILNRDSISLPLTVSSGTYSGWNFVANPYPSSINWNASSGWTRNVLENADTVGKALWIWNAALGNYGCYISNSLSDFGTNGVTRNIAVSQGFWVKAITTGNMSMSSAVKEHADQAFLKSATTIPDLLRLVVSGSANVFKDELIIRFGNSNDTGGAEKMFSIDARAPGIYSTKLNKNWSINMLTSVAEHAVVPVGFKPGVNGIYTITVSNLNSFTLPTNAYLKDIANNTLADLHQNSSYSFSATTNDNANRFQLLFSALPMNISDNILKNISIYAFDNSIYINSNEPIQQINIYNTLGQLIKTIENTNGKVAVNMSEYADGNYIVKLITNKDVYSKKVFIKN
jgi:M6 family metalloprotease-like protein